MKKFREIDFSENPDVKYFVLEDPERGTPAIYYRERPYIEPEQTGMEIYRTRFKKDDEETLNKICDKLNRGSKLDKTEEDFIAPKKKNK